MHLIEIFLSLTDNRGKPFDDSKFAEVRKTLAEQFGGVTAFTRAPGGWRLQRCGQGSP
jgi:hypothetical protein